MTHPFHPLAGREFVFIALRQTWGEDRVFVYYLERHGEPRFRAEMELQG